jgi:hypothetical protein
MNMLTAIRHGALIISFVCVCSPSWTAAQNLVVNGTFDTGATGWTAANVSNGGYVPSKGNPGGYYELNSWPPSSTTDPAISQVVSGLIRGVSYAVSGDYEKSIDWGGGSPTAFSFGVELDGVFLYEAGQSDYAWHHFSFAFVADSPATTLSITAQRNGTGVSYGIDNITLQPRPSLVVREVGTNVVVSWPTNALGFSLQSSTNLTGAGWSSVTNATVIVGSNYSLTLKPAQQKQLFRLKE